MSDGAIGVESDIVYFVDLRLDFSYKFWGFAKELGYIFLLSFILLVLSSRKVLICQCLNVSITLLHLFSCLKLLLDIFEVLLSLFIFLLNNLFLFLDFFGLWCLFKQLIE